MNSWVEHFRKYQALFEEHNTKKSRHVNGSVKTGKLINSQSDERGLLNLSCVVIVKLDNIILTVSCSND